MRPYLQMNDMLRKLQCNSCQWYDVRTVHLHGTYQIQVVCYIFTMAVMGTATMNATYNCSVFLLLPMDIVCSWCVWSTSRHKLGSRPSMWGIGTCDMMAHVSSITCKIWFWIRHKFCYYVLFQVLFSRRSIFHAQCLLMPISYTSWTEYMTTWNWNFGHTLV